MAAVGLTEADYEDDEPPPLVVWPWNVSALDVFYAMSTQWRIGFAGPTGLDYTALPVVFDLLTIPQERRPGIFGDVRVIEQGALLQMGENRDEDERSREQERKH